MPTPPKTDTRGCFPDAPIPAGELKAIPKAPYMIASCLGCGRPVDAAKGRICSACQKRSPKR